MMISVLYIVA